MLDTKHNETLIHSEEEEVAETCSTDLTVAPILISEVAFITK